MVQERTEGRCKDNENKHLFGGVLLKRGVGNVAVAGKKCDIQRSFEDGRNYTLASFANKNICGGEIRILVGATSLSRAREDGSGAKVQQLALDTNTDIHSH